jgi:CRISPR/Cas system Type II protein with McrA/HNH and RuvC-like nuclease domain
LNGYQKGKCFYCDAAIFIDNNLNADVDHFFPHKLKYLPEIGSVVDGIWNLVLSCIDCNRGVDGKFDKLPSLPLLIKLSHRNEYLIKSHHPLRETLINQTGRFESDRKGFLNNIYQKSLGVSFHTWAPKL